MKIRLTALVMLFVITAFSLSAQDQQETIQALTSLTRGLEPLREVEVNFITAQEEYSYSPEDYDQSWYELWSQFYRAFDLIAPDTNLAKTDQAMSTQQGVGGYYVPGVDVLNIITPEAIEGEMSPLVAMVYAHEYTHALQDQHFDLEGDLSRLIDNTDEQAALRALIEGDAMFTEQLFALAMADKDPAYLDPSLVGDYQHMAIVPAIFEDESFLPYFDGMAFIKALHTLGGWEMVNSAYDDPPRSTEHILHPERYLAGDAPVEVALRPVGHVLPGWEEITDDTLGEFYLRAYLSTQLDSAVVNTAALGWGGDRYTIYYNSSRQKRAWVLRLVWDTVDDADEFAAAYRLFAAARIDGVSREIDTDVTCWEHTGHNEALCMQTLPNGTLIASGVNSRQALDLLSTQQAR
ncbi:MAG: hypothetical protein OHK0046_13020 [Anaerolineae bacterium]